MKKVLLDCGANQGQSYDVFFKNRDDADQYEIHIIKKLFGLKMERWIFMIKGIH